MKKAMAIASGVTLVAALLVAFLPVGVAAQEGASSPPPVTEEGRGECDQLRAQDCYHDGSACAGNAHYKWEDKAVPPRAKFATSAKPYSTSCYGAERALDRIYQNRIANLERALERLQEDPEANAEAIRRLEQRRVVIEERYQEAKLWLDKHQEMQSATGTLAEVDTQTHTLAIEITLESELLTLKLRPSTIIIKDGERVFYDELNEGEYVSGALYFITGDGPTAVLVIVDSEAPATED